MLDAYLFYSAMYIIRIIQHLTRNKVPTRMQRADKQLDETKNTEQQK